MRVGIYGGTFNPPHIGHESSAREAAQQLGLDLLIVVPAGVPPHKPLPEGSPCADIRLILASIAFYRHRNTVVSDIEARNPGPSYTVVTAGEIKRAYPGAELFLLVGADMYLTLESWKSAESLLGNLTPAVFSRGDGDAQRILDYSARVKNRFGADTVIVKNTIVPVSSSGLREMLPKRGGVGYINDTNYSYIIKNRLYCAKPEWNWLRSRAHSMLDPERVPHAAACEEAAVTLAERWGVDPDDAREAAILHDITKRLGTEAHMRVLEDHGERVGTLKFAEEKLLHAKSGAALARAVFGVSSEVEDAIKWHTTGRRGMTDLEKVIYMADYIEATRDFPGVGEMRKLAYDDIDEAMVMGLEATVADISARGITPNQETLGALDDLKR